MPRAVARPFRVATDRSVSVTDLAWTLVVGGEEANLLELREHLRTSNLVTIEGQIAVNLDAFREETGLHPSAEADALFMWECAATRRREVGARVSVANSGVISGSFDVATDGLAESIRLERQIVLRRPGGDNAPFVAKRSGNMLWRERTPLRVDLEGSGGVLPTDITSFAYPLAPEAVWTLHVDTSDLLAPVRANVRLVLNEDHPDIAYLVAYESRDDRARAILSSMHWDCGRTLIRAALRDEMFDLADEYPEDSIGRALQNLITSVFPEYDLLSIKELEDNRPMDFETELQSALQLFRGRAFRRYKKSSPAPDAAATADARKAADEGLTQPAEEVGQASEVKRQWAGGSPHPVGPVGAPPSADEIATYKQIRMIVGLSGVWLGKKEIESRPDTPQVPLFKEEARELIELLLTIPASGDKAERGATVDAYLKSRFQRFGQ